MRDDCEMLQLEKGMLFFLYSIQNIQFFRQHPFAGIICPTRYDETLLRCCDESLFLSCPQTLIVTTMGQRNFSTNDSYH